MAFDSTGNLYVANSGNNTILKFDSANNGSSSVFASTGLNKPSGLAFDSAGFLYAVNNGDNTIEKFSPAGVPTLFANTGLSSPTYIAIAAPEPSTLALATAVLVPLIFRRNRPRS